MAFGGILILNILLMIVLGMAGVGIICLLLCLIFFLAKTVDRKKGNTPKKWKGIAAVVCLIIGISCMIIPAGLCLIVYPNEKIEVNTPDGTVKIREMKIKSLQLAIGNDDAEEVEKLLKKTPDLFYYTRDSLTTLGMAIDTNSVNVVALLLEAGVDVNVVDKLDFDTSMTLVTRSIQKETAEKSFAIMELLMDHGADMNDRLSGITPVQYLIRYILEDSGVDEKELVVLERFLQEGADLTIQNLAKDDAVDVFEQEVYRLEPDEQQQSEIKAMRELLLEYYETEDK